MLKIMNSSRKNGWKQNIPKKTKNDKLIYNYSTSLFSMKIHHLNVIPVLVFLALVMLSTIILSDVVTTAETSQTLVSNLNQQVNQFNHIRVNGTYSSAQQFTTGNNPVGYRLSSVSIKVKEGSSTHAPQVRIHSTNATGNLTDGSLADVPGSMLYNLSGNMNSSGNREFTAPDDSMLDPNTKYFVYVGDGSGGGSVWLYATFGKTGEDSGGAEGWSVGDARLGNTSSGWFQIDRYPLLIKVKGNVISNNNPPVFSFGPNGNVFYVNENVRRVGTITASDPDVQDNITSYGISAAPEYPDDVTFFNIDSSGVLTFNSAPDHENPSNSGGDNVYQFLVKASSGTGDRVLDSYHEVVVFVNDVNEPPSAPAKPELNSLTSTSLLVNWVAPSNTGPAITDYDVKYREGSSGSFSNWNHDNTATNTTITNLSSNTNYQVRIRAHNAEGISDWSPVANGTTGTLLTPVISDVEASDITEDSANITVTISNPDGSAKNIYYRVWVILAGQMVDSGVVNTSTSSTTFRLTDLFEGWYHRVDVSFNDTFPHEDTLRVRFTPMEPNDPPVFNQDSYTFYLDENVNGNVNPVRLGKVSATDPDNDNLTYAITYGETDKFTINSSSGEIEYIGSGEDYETRWKYALGVQVSDSVHNVNKQVAINVNDLDENGNDSAPVFSQDSYTFTLNENQAGSPNPFSIGTVTATDFDTGDTITYSITQSDTNKFNINSATGQITYIGSGEDYETGTTQYTLTVKASDGTNEDTATVTININNLNDLEFEQNTYTFNLDENADGSTTPKHLGTVIAKYADSIGNTEYSIQSGDTNKFNINSTMGQITYIGTGEDYESGTTQYTLTVKASDGTNEDTATVTININNLNDNPLEFEQSTYIFSLDENADGSTTPKHLGTVIAKYADSIGNTEYSIQSGDTNKFNINSTMGQITYIGTGEDYESGTTQYTLTVKASDGTNEDTATVTININNLNDNPLEFEQNTYTFNLDENADGSTTPKHLGTVTATDSDNSGNIEYSIQSGDTNKFNINSSSGEVEYIGSGEDYETQSQYTLTVQASNGANDANTNVKIEINNLNDNPPDFNVANFEFYLDENADGSTTPRHLGTVTATDPDNDNLTYFITSATNKFRINSATGELTYTGSGEDYETLQQLLITIKASDGKSSHERHVSVYVNINDLNDDPEFNQSSYTFSLNENEDGSSTPVPIGTVAATDEDVGDTLRYSITRGDTNKFDVLATGEITYTGSGENYENQNRYRLTIQVSDGTSTDDANVEININNLNEAPQFTRNSYTFNLNENQDGSSTPIYLGTVTATDTESDPITYSIQSGDTDKFNIGRASGRITYIGSGENQESQNHYQLTIQASDGNSTDTANVEININNLNEAPQFTKNSYTFNLNENQDGSTTPVSIGTVTVTDDESDPITYSIQSGDTNKFNIDQTSGHITYIGSGENYENQNQYQLTIQASDGNSTDTAYVEININNLNEAPQFTKNSYTFNLNENQDGSTTPVSIGTVTATDAESNLITYSIQSGDTNKFNIDQTSGHVTYIGSGENYENQNQYQLTIQASDGNSTDTAYVEINIINRVISISIDDPLSNSSYIILSQNEVAVEEGVSTGTAYTVKLSRQPSQDVNVTLSKDDTVTLSITNQHGVTEEGVEQLQVNPTQLTFTTRNWNVPKAVRLSAHNDDIALDRTVIITHTGQGGDYEGVQKALEVTMNNDDPVNPGLDLSDSILAVEEGYSQTYTVKLIEQPSRDDQGIVIVRLTTNDPSLTVFPEALTFKRSNWNVSQTVQAFAEHDDDSRNDHATITHNATGAGYDVRDFVSVNIDDDEPANPMIIINETSTITLNENERAVYSIKLNEKPSSNVIVNISSDNPDVTVNYQRITFTKLNWNVSRDVTVRAANDNGGLNDVAILTHNATGGGYDQAEIETLNIFVNDDEPADPSVIILPSKALNINENSNATYQVKLSERPEADVTVSLRRNNSEVEYEPAYLKFTTQNWNTPQQINLTAGKDDTIDDEQVILTHTANGGGYDSVEANLTVNLIDVDVAGITMSSRLTVEEGTTDQYTIRLDTEPTSNVQISLTVDNGDLKVSHSTLTFTPNDWNFDRTIVVEAINDGDSNDENAVVTHTISSQDADYNRIQPIYFIVKIDDDELDNPNLVITPSRLEIDEDGNADYSVKLSTPPSGDVTLDLTVSDRNKAFVSPSSLTFTSQNWNAYQNVTVTGSSDDDGLDEHINVTNDPRGGGYDSVSNIELPVTIRDLDPEQPQILVPSMMAIDEGETNTYTVRLSEKPTEDVTVTITSDSGIMLNDASTTSLIFTPENWNILQIVEITAEQDDDNSDEMISVTHRASGGGYHRSKDAVMQVVVNDDEPANPTITITPSTMTIEEGEIKNYDVKLNEEPNANVTITLAFTKSLIRLNQSSLVFTPENWNQVQTVQITAKQDYGNENNLTTITHTANGGGYDNVQKNLSVDIDDDEPQDPSIIIEPSDVTINEGEIKNYDVKLNEKPTSDVTINLTFEGSLIELDSSSLMFTPEDWDQAQTIQITSKQDEDKENNLTTITHTANGGGYDNVQKNLNINVTDDELQNPSIMVEPSTLTIEEGETENYDVKLNEKPKDNVTVTLSVSDLNVINVDRQSLMFTPENWDQAQTIQITSKQDEDKENNQATITHTANGGGYEESQEAIISITIDDDELTNPLLMISTEEINMEEGSARGYSIRLSETPKGEVTVAISSNRASVAIRPSVLSFSVSNWNVEQNVKISVLEDDDADNDSAIIGHRVSGGGYDNVETPSLMVNIADNDDPSNITNTTTENQSESETPKPRIIVSDRSLDIDEGDEEEYSVKLSQAPTGEVTVRIRSTSSDVQASPRTLTFTTSNWDEEQDVDVSVDEDDDTRNEDATLNHVASGGGYDNVEKKVEVEVDDDDRSSTSASSTRDTQPSAPAIQLPTFKSSESLIDSRASNSWTSWKRGQSYTANLEDRNVILKDITFTPIRTSLEPIAFVARLNSRPESIKQNPNVDDVYGFFELATNNAVRQNINTARATLVVEQDWLESQNLDGNTLKLFAWNERTKKWQAVAASRTNTSEGSSLIAQISLSSSIFAVGANEIAIVAPEVEETQEVSEESVEQTESEEEDQKKIKISSLHIILGAAIFVILLLAVVLAIKII